MNMRMSQNPRRWLLIALLAPTAAFAAESDFKWSVGAALGYDDNAYLSPDAPYVDLAATGTPLVTPEKQSGLFADVGAGATYTHALSNSNKLIAEYKFTGDFYLDSALRNANEYKHRLTYGREHILRSKGARRDTVYFGAIASAVKDVYFDRDSGVDKATTSGADISDRYSYRSIGAEAEYRNRVSRVQYGFSGSFERLDYKNPVVVRQYDHNYIKLAADIGFDITEGTKLSADYTYRLRDYSDRLSRDASGALLSTNPNLKYTYHTIGASLRQRLNRSWVVYLDGDYKLRDDGYVGYNDYDGTTFKVRALFKPAGPWSVRFSADTWKRNYSNAFAFDLPTQPAKAYKGSDADLRVEWTHSNGMTLWGGVDLVRQKSSDARYEYDRFRSGLGVEWNFMSK